MILEHVTGRNVFSIFGGVPEFALIRDGKIRAQAVFAHPIVAGTVGANLLALFIGLWWQRGKSKMLAGAGVVSALVMTIASSSATPVAACGVAGRTLHVARAAPDEDIPMGTGDLPGWIASGDESAGLGADPANHHLGRQFRISPVRTG